MTSPPKERDIAIVFQSYGLYPHKTVSQNMGFALKLAQIPKADIEKRVQDAAPILGLTDYLDAKLRVKMRAEIKELHQRLKTTSVYVTHDQKPMCF